MKEKLTANHKGFVQGYACAVATLLLFRRGDDAETDELFYAGIGTIEKAREAGVDVYDLKILRKYYGNTKP